MTALVSSEYVSDPLPSSPGFFALSDSVAGYVHMPLDMSSL